MMSFFRLVALLGVVVLTTACSTTQPGIAQPTRTAPPSGTPDSAPPVPAALPVASWLRSPCSLLSAAQLKALGMTSATTSTVSVTAVMTGCVWDDASVGTGVQLDIEAETALPHGLSDIYLQQGSAAYWEPLTVDGYPGVLTDAVDERQDGTCRMSLGVTDTNVLDLAYQGTATDPCTHVRALGAAVITSLKDET